jgi:hypothetical protein
VWGAGPCLRMLDDPPPSHPPLGLPALGWHGEALPVVILAGSMEIRATALDGEGNIDVGTGGGRRCCRSCSSAVRAVRGRWVWAWCGGRPVGALASDQKMVAPPCGTRLTLLASDLVSVAGGCDRKWALDREETLGR